MWSNFKKTGAKMFRFHVLHSLLHNQQHTIVALSGDKARKAFFNEQGLDLTEGYRIFMGGIPQLSDIAAEADQSNLSFFLKRLLNLLKKQRVNQLLPTLFEDVQRRMEDWGKEGILNPFKEVYELVFQMTVRLATCRELSEDKEAISQLARHYWELEKSATPFALLFPWFPCPAKKAKQEATQNLYDLLSEYVNRRRKATERTTDAIDVLIAEGDSDDAIIGVMTFTSVLVDITDLYEVCSKWVINTGMNVCWNLLYLGMNPEWREKVYAEVQALLTHHSDALPSQPLHQRLASIPMQAWEDEMPVLDSVIRETLRVVATGTLLRRNLGKDVEIEGSTIRRGDFLAFSSADVHHNPEIYPEPLLFDPGRYDEGRGEDKKVPLGYVGWGAGRHPCAGMRIAKLEMKLVLALIFAGYKFEIVDAAGKLPSVLPRPDKNDIQQARPLGEPCFLKFSRVVE
ncbi:hypothetical protein C0995_005771 [Termitomyces sp. Mi166|nr:hypothetical protein C0995_005771 [Termitomyces sp. Mi166\